METKQEISIRIAANPNASGGYRIIEGHNIIDNSFKENDYSGFSRNSYYFAFSIKEGWADYCLLQNNVFSHGASRQSPALKIYVSIPKGYALQQKKSPFDLLVDIRNSFLNRCMTNRSDGSYEYKESVNLDFLQDVARNYPLVPYNGPYRPMGGSAKAWTKDSALACIVVPDETKIRELLGDVQYPEFENYDEIVVATAYDGIQYPVLKNLSIPRPCTYKVYIDGQSKGAITDKSKAYNVDFPVDNRYYDITPVSFTIADLLNGNKVDGVTINAQNETINIKSSSFVKEKIHEVKVEVNPKSATTKELLQNSPLNKNSPLNIYYMAAGNKIHLNLDNNLKFKLEGMQIGFLDNPSAFRVEYKGNKYNINNCIFSEDKKSFVINVTLKDQSLDTTNNSNGSTGGTASVPINDLCIDTSWMKKGKLTLIYKKQDNKRSKKQGNMLKSEVEVPSLNKKLTKEDFKSYKPSSKYLRLIVFFLGIILGGIAGYLLHSAIGDSDVEDNICSKCGQPFDSQEKLEEHEEKSHDYACDLCDKAFTDAASLQEHEDKDHPVCSKCGEQFSNPEEFRKHEENPHAYECDKCTMAFTTKAGLDAHKRDKHPVYKCEECSKVFDTKRERDEHYGRTHCACKICGPDKWFKTKEELESHMKTRHSNIER